MLDACFDVVSALSLPEKEDASQSNVMTFLEVFGLARPGEYLHLDDEQWLAPIMLLL